MTTPDKSSVLRPRPYEFVGMAVGGAEDGMVLHRSVSAMKVPCGFMVQVFEYSSVATPSPLPQGPPSPGRFVTLHMPVSSLDAVREAFFIEGDEAQPPVVRGYDADHNPPEAG